jgi:hypothetical protein
MRGVSSALVSWLVIASSGCGRFGYASHDAGARSDVFVAMGLDAFAAPDVGTDAHVPIGVDADLDAFVTPDAGTDAYVPIGVDADLDAFVASDAAADAAPRGCVPGALRHDAIGSGTPVDPYVLCNATQWNSFVEVGIASASYQLGADLDIDRAREDFAGTFDGAGFTIRGTISPSSTSVFGDTMGATFSRLRVEVDVTPGASTDDVGVVTSESSGTTFDRVSVVSRVVWGGRDVGGLAASCLGCTVRDSWVSIDRFIADERGGLLFGSSNGGTVERVAVASLQLEPRETRDCVRVGGLIGDAQGTVIREALARVEVLPMGAGGYGGAVGRLEGGGSLSDVRVEGRVPETPSATCGSEVGGVVGEMEGGATLERALASAVVNAGGPNDGGGLVGTASGSTISTSAVVGAGLPHPHAVLADCDLGTTVRQVYYWTEGLAEIPRSPACRPDTEGRDDRATFFGPREPPFDSWDFSGTWSAGADLPRLARVPTLP